MGGCNFIILGEPLLMKIPESKARFSFDLIITDSIEDIFLPARQEFYRQIRGSVYPAHK